MTPIAHPPLYGRLLHRVAVNVRRHRLKLGLSQIQAAGAVEMHWRHWQKIEAGKVNLSLKTMIAIFAALDLEGPHVLLRELPLSIVDLPPRAQGPSAVTDARTRLALASLMRVKPRPRGRATAAGSRRP